MVTVPAYAGLGGGGGGGGPSGRTGNLVRTKNKGGEVDGGSNRWWRWWRWKRWWWYWWWSGGSGIIVVAVNRIDKSS